MREDHVFEHICRLKHEELEKRLSLWKNDLDEIKEEFHKMNSEFNRQLSKIYYIMLSLTLTLIANLIIMVLKK